MFEKATRKKVRFSTNKGDVTVEELWDLPLEARNNCDLATVEVRLLMQLRDTQVVSSVKPRTKTNDLNELRLEIVKHIIAVKLAERDAKQNDVAKKAEKEMLLGILGEQQNAALRNLTPEELQAKIDSL